MSDKFTKKSESFVRLLEIMDRLRVECPWDRAQTMTSLRANTIEECFELTDAIVAGDMAEVKKELGDLLLHIVFYSKIADEERAFDIADVCDSICDKLIYRHPHVFSDVEVEDAAAVSKNWEQLKLRENDAKPRGVLAGVAGSMPSLPKAYRIGEKVANVGFDWEQREDVWAKVREEIAEVEVEAAAMAHDKLEAEFGDLFFALTNAARLYGINPDTALERTNQKFIRRFNYLESKTLAQGIRLTDMTLAQMDEIWDEAKSLEK